MDYLSSICELTKELSENSILISHRFIIEGDEEALLPEEAVYFRNALSKVRRRSGAARIVARELLSRLNCDDVPITKSPSGAPVWPTEVVGSLAHEVQIAVAAVAQKSDILALGVDIEPADDLPDNLVNVIATATEQSRYGQPLLRSRQLFVAKEAVYKAVHPLDQCFLDFHEIEVDLSQQEARVIYGRSVAVKVRSVGSHVMALAFLRADR